MNGWSEIILDVGSFVSLSEHGHRESGLADARIGYKVRLVDVNVSRWVPVLSLSGGTSIPNGADAFGSSSLQPFADIGAHWSLSHRFGIVTSASIANLDDGLERSNEVISATSAEFTLSEAVHAHLEYARIQPFADGAHGANDVSAASATTLHTTSLWMPGSGLLGTAVSMSSSSGSATAGADRGSSQEGPKQ